MATNRHFYDRGRKALRPSADLDRIAALEDRCALYEHSIDTLLLLADRMTAHPHRSVRAYSGSIQRVLGPFANPPLAREFDPSIVLPGGVSVSQTVATFLRRWGDDLEGEDRWIDAEDSTGDGPLSTGPVAEEQRAWMCTDWLIRTHTSAWVALAGMEEDATLLRAIEPITSAADLKRAEAVVRSVAVRSERQRARLTSAAAVRRRPAGEAAPSAQLVQIARSAWAASAAGAAVEAGAAWCPQASRTTEAALWTWALRRAEQFEDEAPPWRGELQSHVDHLQHSALALVEELILLGPPAVLARGLEDL